MLEALKGYSDAKDYFKRRFDVKFRKPNLKKIDEIRDILMNECTLEDLKVLKVASKSELDETMVFSSTITAFGAVATIIGVIINNSLEKNVFIFIIILFALLLIISAAIFIKEIGRLSLLNEIVIQSYEQRKAEELESSKEKEPTNIIEKPSTCLIVMKE
ncbi:hypothetical protein [Paenibacillus sp. BJ-4]|uniref:hypothetical protein n=1 Tax=Paenibacillus sp. BJ-4 TaxID=2878097 RepID=UPI001CF0386B|nr:hypothetical protein [Paenibacillus sp. BJ-4]